MPVLHTQFTPKMLKDLRVMVFGQKTEYRLKLRASIIWCYFRVCMPIVEVAASLGITVKTTQKWLARFESEGCAGLHDRPRCGAPTLFTPEQRCEVIAIACDKPHFYGFADQPHWTYDTLTVAVNQTIPQLSMSRSSVARTLTQTKLKPHRIRMWLHSPDPDFRKKVNDIVSLYLQQPEDTVVLCIDEKTGMQATERKYETIYPLPGRPGRYEYEYIRHGTQSLLAAFNIGNGRVIARCGAQRKAEDLLAFMEGVVAEYAHKKRIIVIWDNLNIHYDGRDERWRRFNEKHGGKLEFHYTPIHASWVNQVEIFFGILQRRCLRHGNFYSVDDLKTKVMTFIDRWNTFEGHPFNWTFRGYPLQDKEAA